MVPTYATSFYVDATDSYGNVVDSHAVTDGEARSTHQTYDPVVASPFSLAPVPIFGGSAAEPTTDSGPSARGRWRPSRPASSTVTYADGEFIRTDFSYTDQQEVDTTSCTPHSAYDLACEQGLALLPDVDSRALAEVQTSASGQNDSATLFVYDIYGNVVLSRASAEDGTEVEHHAHYESERHLYRAGAHGPTGFPAFVSWDTTLGQPLAMIDMYGRETHFRYDGLGRLTYKQLVDEGGSVHAASIGFEVERVHPLEVEDDGLPTSSPERARSTFADGRWTEITAGEAGLPVAYRWATGEPEGPVSSEVEYLQYELGRVYRASEPAFEGEEPPSWSTIVYDASGRLIRQRQPDGSEFRTRYLPREEWQFDAEGNPPNRMSFDGHGRVSRVQDAHLTQFCYTYDARSNLDKVQKGCFTGPPAEEVDLDYDTFGRLEQLVDPSSGTTTYDYDGRGRLEDVVDGNDIVRAWKYDALDRVVAEASPDGLRQNYYDSPGNLPANVADYLDDPQERPGKLLAQTYDNTATVSTYRYNSFGDVTETLDVVDGAEFRHAFSYDGNQRLDAIAYPSTDDEKLVVTLGYNSVGQLERVRDALRKETLLEVQSRNARSQVTEVEHFGGATTTQRFDDMGRVDWRRTRLKLTTIFHQEYAYTANGNVDHRWNHQSGLQESFGYDALGRLTSSSLAGTWGYDAYGNSDDVSATPGGQLVSVPGVYTAEYDDAGQLLYYADEERALEVDWNADGEPGLITSTTPCCGEMSPQNLGSETVELFYGPAGELVRRRATYADNAAVERDSLYVGGFESTVSDNGGNKISTLTQRWSIPSVGGVTLTATAKSGAEEGFAYHAGTADALGSVQTVVTATHDGELGEASKSDNDGRSYDPWGNPRAETFGVGVPTFDAVNDGFTGHRAQLDGGLVDMNLRHYDPESRRFISPDPVVAGLYDTQAWNRYAYVRNNPLRWVDPTGAYGQSPYGGGNNLYRTYNASGPAGAVAILAAAIASSAASGALGGFFKSVRRKIKNLFTRSKGSRGGGAPSTATPAPSYAHAGPTVIDQFEQAARAEGGRLRDAAAAGVSAVGRAWDDPLGTARNGVTGWYGFWGDAAVGYYESTTAHFAGIGSGLWQLGGDLVDDPLGTAWGMGRDTVVGVVNNGSAVLEAEATTMDALREFDLSGAAAAQWDVAANSYEAAGTVVPAAKGLKSVATFAKNASRAGKLGGRAGKQARLRALADDPKVSSADRGWIKNEMRHIKTGNRKSIRMPGNSRNSRPSPRRGTGKPNEGPGKELAHRRGRAAKDGHGYEHADLQDADLHRLQHRIEGY